MLTGQRMSRVVVALLAAVAVLALSATAQPFIADVSKEASHQFMPVAPFDGSSEANTTLYYASTHVPWNAYSDAQRNGPLLPGLLGQSPTAQ